MSLKHRKIFSGFGWVALITYANKAFSFITTLILAKLLTPEDFGLVALAHMIIEVVYILKDMGLSQALIYRPDNIEETSNTCFWMILLLNFLIFLIAVCIAPLAARFFENPGRTRTLTGGCRDLSHRRAGPRSVGRAGPSPDRKVPTGIRRQTAGEIGSGHPQCSADRGNHAQLRNS